jgi:uncharacterized protein (DUF305 family)
MRRAVAGFGLAAALAGCSQEAAETAPAKDGMGAMAMGDPASPYAQANARMHAAMTQPDDPDPGRNFAEKMSAHHKGAVEMAEIALREVQDPEMRALAQKIISDQNRELAQMKAYLDRTAPRGAN